MADHSSIEWTDATWNPITGCALASEGCRHCYAARLAATRLRNHPSRAGLARLNAAGEAKFTGQVRFNEEWLTQPLHWKRPRRIFVCAHGDLFAEGVPDEWIDRVFAVMALAPQHTFQVLTKRAARMREYLSATVTSRLIYDTVCDLGIDLPVVLIADPAHEPYAPPGTRVHLGRWPLANVWLGVSAEDQKNADERVPELLAAPAAIRFVSAEPLLGPLDFTRLRPSEETRARSLSRLPNIDALRGAWYIDGHVPASIDMDLGEARLDQIIVGGESGPRARPMHPDWARKIRDDCAAAGTAFFFKQWGEWVEEAQVADAAETYDADLKAGRTWRFTGVPMRKRGKKAAGRLLDAVEHNAMPVAREVPAL